MMSKAKLRAKLLEPKAEASPTDWSKGLSTGSTLINLACSGRPSVGFLPGHYYLWVGDSGSGKTFITLTTLAEAANNPEYSKHRLVFYDAERGALMDFRKYFGGRLVDRLQHVQPDQPTLESFYDFLDDLNREGPFVLLLDSMDVLIPRAYQVKLGKDRKAREGGREEGGSYGTEKARINSDRLRIAIPSLTRHGSILIVLSQTRDNIGWSSQFDPKTRGGGKALTFYASLELWTSVREHLKKTVRGNPVEHGITVRVKVKKNRQTGGGDVVEVPIYHSLGIDDLGSCVDYLTHWRAWKEEKGYIQTQGFCRDGTREAIIEVVEEEGKETELRLIVTEVWKEVEEACMVSRKRRYE